MRYVEQYELATSPEKRVDRPSYSNSNVSANYASTINESSRSVNTQYATPKPEKPKTSSSRSRNVSSTYTSSGKKTIDVSSQSAVEPDKKPKGISYSTQKVSSQYTQEKGKEAEIEPVVPSEKKVDFFKAIQKEFQDIKEYIPQVMQKYGYAIATETPRLVSETTKIKQDEIKNEIKAQIDNSIKQISDKAKLWMMIAGAFAGVTILLQIVMLIVMIRKRKRD